NVILFLTDDTPFQFTYGEPHFHLWYIVSLGVWYSIVYVISKFNLNARDKWIVFIILCIIGFMSRWYTDSIEDFINQFYDKLSTYTVIYAILFCRLLYEQGNTAKCVRVYSK